MTLPREFHDPRTISPRLVTKTSLPDAKKALSLSILMWQAMGKPSEIEYGIEQQTSALLLDESIADTIIAYLNGLMPSTVTKRDLLKWAEKNPLLCSQAEALNAAFELVWHLGRFSFADSSLNITAERTGGKRFRKIIRFTNNIDILDAHADSSRVEFTRVLIYWLSGNPLYSEKTSESRLVRILTSFAELSFYKTKKGDDGLIYVPSGVYDALADGADSVELVDFGSEAQGPTRILKAAIKDGLNSYLGIRSGGDAVIADGVSRDALEAYSRRVATGIELSRIVVTQKEERSATSNGENQGQPPRNLIFFGAPGTGKSFELNRRALGQGAQPGLFDSENVSRVTFHPDYTYAQFVGCYKPFSTGDTIGYHFVPGPFIKTYEQAVKNPERAYLLIIEEINRANPAAVFGDVFQLLDRNSEGVSEYPVSTSEDLNWYLYKMWLGILNGSRPEGERRYDLDDPEAREMASYIAIPSNMYIWATMNSADQGVFPMDTAFKRRWGFEYMDINNSEGEIEPYRVPVGNIGAASWNKIRHGINMLLRDAGVNEDKWIGPFFIKPDVLADEDRFKRSFKDKVLLYLYEDAAKTKRSKVFSNGSMTYSEICKEYDEKGLDIFRETFDADFVEFEAEDPARGFDMIEDTDFAELNDAE